MYKQDTQDSFFNVQERDNQVGSDENTMNSGNANNDFQRQSSFLSY